MKYLLLGFLLLTISHTSCDISSTIPERRNIDWKKEWENNQTKLKTLAQDIMSNGSKKYTTGNNKFPNNFKYPFDDGFFINRQFNKDGTETENIDVKKLTITFYVDRGLLDHYSAFIFTNDSTDIKEFDRNVENGGNDFKIEPNWYMIND